MVAADVRQPGPDLIAHEWFFKKGGFVFPVNLAADSHTEPYRACLNDQVSNPSEDQWRRGVKCG